jgi:hypothetical protein
MWVTHDKTTINLAQVTHFYAEGHKVVFCAGSGAIFSLDFESKFAASDAHVRILVELARSYHIVRLVGSEGRVA